MRDVHLMSEVICCAYPVQRHHTICRYISAT